MLIYNILILHCEALKQHTYKQKQKKQKILYAGDIKIVLNGLFCGLQKNSKINFTKSDLVSSV